MHPIPPESPGIFRRPPPRRGGFSLLEAIAAMVITVIVASTVIATLLNSQTFAARTRVMTNARMIVQRNIETALGVPYTSVNVPDILKLTADEENGEIYREGASAGEDGGEDGEEDNTMTVAITGEGDTVVEGTLRRIVTDLPDDEKPEDILSVIRRITFRIEYEYLGRDYSYEMSTIRARDD